MWPISEVCLLRPRMGILWVSSVLLMPDWLVDGDGIIYGCPVFTAEAPLGPRPISGEPEKSLCFLFQKGKNRIKITTFVEKYD